MKMYYNYIRTSSCAEILQYSTNTWKYYFVRNPYDIVCARLYGVTEYLNINITTIVPEEEIT